MTRGDGKTFRVISRLLLVPACALLLGTFALGESSRNRVINSDNPGKPMEIKKYLVPGSTNIFCFYSKYCGACRAVLPELDEMIEKHPELVLNKVDINRPNVKKIDWQSPVAKQYKITFTPYFKIFDGSGNLTADDKQAFEKIGKLLDEE